MSEPAPPNPSGSHAPAVALSGVVSLLFMWPAVSHFFTRPMLGGGDGYYFYWVLWWVPDQLGQGHNPFSTDLLFHPVGADLRLSALVPLLAIVTSPVRMLLGPAAQINALQIGAAWLTALAAYFLIHRVVGHRWVALIGGLAFSFSPFRAAHAQGHLNLILTAFLPLAILTLLRYLDAPTRARAVALGAVVGAAFLTDPHLAVLTITCLIPVGVWARHRLRQSLPHLLLAAGVTLLVAAPLLIPMVGGVLADEGNPISGPASTVAYSSDPARWVVPPPSHPLLGDAASRIRSPLSIEGVAYPGLVILVLAVAACRLRSLRDRSVWIAVAVLGIVLSLGPYPSIDRTYVQVPLPFWVLGKVPFFNTMRAAGRFAIVGVLGLDILAMMALARLAGHRRAVLAGVAAVLAFELLPGHPPLPPRSAPAPYKVITADDTERAVLELPLQWSTGKIVIGNRVADRDATIFLGYATTHGHPLVNGSVSRYSDERLERLREIPLYRQLLALQGDPGFTEPPSFEERDLAELGIGFVVYHRDAPLPAVYRYFQTLDLPVLADDGTVVIWGVTLRPGADEVAARHGP